MGWHAFEEHWDNTFVRELGWLGVRIDPAPVATPSLLAVDDELARELGLDPDQLRTPEGLTVLAGNAVAPGSEPIAQGYAGHQFGQLSPLLGDGRAHLLGEVVDTHGRRRDIALKGSGRTPFSRGGDGRAVVGPVIREYLRRWGWEVGRFLPAGLALASSDEDLAAHAGLIPVFAVTAAH